MLHLAGAYFLELLEGVCDDDAGGGRVGVTKRIYDSLGVTGRFLLGLGWLLLLFARKQCVPSVRAP